MITSSQQGLIYANGIYLGEIRPDAPVFRPISPYGALCIEMRPFAPMTLSCACRITMSAGKPVSQSLENEGDARVVAWPFGITEIKLSPRRIHTCAPVIKTLTGTSRVNRYIQCTAFSCLETEFMGRVSVHPLPDSALEPVLAEGEGVLYVSGSLRTGGRYALCLTQSGENILLSVTGNEIRFLPGGKILVIKSANDLACHEIHALYAPVDSGYQEESVCVYPNPSGKFQAVTPAECALCALECMLLHLSDELSEYLCETFSPSPALTTLTSEASGASRLRFTPPDGRNAVAAIKTVTPAFSEAIAVYYKSELVDGKWKIFDMKP